jgi:predicted membrane protein
MEERQTSFQHSMNVQFGRAQRGPGFGFWVGLILVVVGGGLLLDAFVNVEFGSILSTWWPSLLMFVAVAQLATGSGSIVGSGILFTVGALLQLSELGYLPGGFWSAFWPIVLILIGLSFISSRWKKKEITFDPGTLGRVSVDGSRIDRSALFTGVEVRVTSPDFTGGELTAIFGGVECDLREARIMGKVAQLSVTAVFGGVELRIPDSWNVVVKGTPIFGGIDDKNVVHPNDPNAPTLVVDATAIFGGVDIRQ